MSEHILPSDIGYGTLPDVVEAAEMACEQMIDDLDIDGSTYRCPFCGEDSPWNEAEQSGPSPYAPPICGKCADKQWPNR